MPKTASVAEGMNFFVNNKRFKYKYTGYVPKRNDIIYFKSDGASHVGIVTSTKGDIVYTVEGNSSDQVQQRQYSMTKYQKISGYGLVADYISKSGGSAIQGTMVDAKFTAYYPDDSPMEGGFYAANGEKLDPKKNTCAAPKSIAFGTNIRVAGTGTSFDGNVYRVNDRGGAIIIDASGVYHIDLLFPDRKSANAFGVHFGQAIIGAPASSAGTVAGITGYNGNGTNATSTATVSTEDTTKAKTELEKKYLNKVLSAHSDALAETRTTTEFEVSKVDTSHKVEFKVMVSRGKKSYVIPVQDGARITWERKNAPGKFTFETIYSDKFKINNGDAVNVYVNDKMIFYGFVFGAKKRKGSDSLSVTVYDQLRYLKNKDTYIYSKWTATKLIKAIAKDFNLEVGTIQSTKQKVSRVDDNQTLMDIIQNCLDETLLETGTIYTLYDDCGKLTLKKPSSMKLKALICAQTAQEYTYNKSIDSGVYNQIKVGVENGATGVLEMYLTKDTKNIDKWGILQYYDTAADAELAKLKGKAMLLLYNAESKTLEVEGVWGNVNVRAGCLIPTVLDLGDTTLSQYMLVDKVTHEFSNHEHTMNISLAGGGFDSSE